jgi:hypothetical protein
VRLGAGGQEGSRFRSWYVAVEGKRIRREAEAGQGAAAGEERGDGGERWRGAAQRVEEEPHKLPPPPPPPPPLQDQVWSYPMAIAAVAAVGWPAAGS